jgi:acetyl-CoA synthetase
MFNESAAKRPDMWTPTPEAIARANVTAAARQVGVADYPALHRWSVEHRDRYWQLVLDRLGIVMKQAPRAIADRLNVPSPTWFPGARMNIVDSCFQAPPTALNSATSPGTPGEGWGGGFTWCAPGANPHPSPPPEYRERGRDSDRVAIIQSDGHGNLSRITVDALRQLTARVANALVADGLVPGQSVGVVMPMTAQSVAIYLGVIAAGGAVVSIADSFAAGEIAARLKLAGASRVFTQDFVDWGGKRLPLYEKVKSAGAGQIIVLKTGDNPCANGSLADFLSDDDTLRTVDRAPQDAINILFSSGTTAEPKAIPWDHTTPLKCAADGHFHQDIHAGDVVCWPTSLGWMMGPWLIFASLLNRASMALFAQSPVDKSFGQFVQDAQVTMLGSVPSLVRAWRSDGRMEGFNWSAIRSLSSSGECSNPDDVRYLMHLAGSKPMIEYCGGTEIGGGYITSTVVQPIAPSTFTTPALGLDIQLRDDEGRIAQRGEVFIQGPSIGLSSRLLNRDHDAIYYRDTPMGPNGVPLRRHGDALEHVSDHAWRVTGRSDDTMNLGGIKVGCAEIERVLNALPGVIETAAVATPPPGGGPSRLTIFAVIGKRDDVTPAALQSQFQTAISAGLNPLFRVDSVVLVDALPRTSSNKIMRRMLWMPSKV